MKSYSDIQRQAARMITAIYYGTPECRRTRRDKRRVREIMRIVERYTNNICSIKGVKTDTKVDRQIYSKH